MASLTYSRDRKIKLPGSFQKDNTSLTLPLVTGYKRKVDIYFLHSPCQLPVPGEDSKNLGSCSQGPMASNPGTTGSAHPLRFCIYDRECMCMCVHACMYMCVYMSVCVCACVYACVCVHSVCVHVCACVYVHVCVHECVCAYVYARVCARSMCVHVSVCPHQLETQPRCCNLITNNNKRVGRRKQCRQGGLICSKSIQRN